MARGIHLGMLLILVQAEHVCCSWATEAHGSQRRNGNTYVGFSQRDGGETRLGGSYPQNKFRQASSSFNPEPVVGSSYNNNHNNKQHNNQGFSQPAQSGSGYSSVRFVQAKVSKPNWPTSVSNNVNAQTAETPQKSRFGLSTLIASGNSVSKYPTKKSYTAIRPRSWPAEQGTRRTGQYLPSSSASSRERNYLTSSSQQSAAQRPRSSPANTPAFSSQGRSASPHPPAQKATLFRSNSYVPNSVQMRTSATAPAQRLTSKHALLSPAGPANTYPSKSASNVESSAVFAPRSMQVKTNQRFNNPRYTSQQNEAGVSSLWNTNAGQPGSHLGSNPGSQRFAPTKTLSIPERFGGFAIRRLREPVDQKPAPQQRHANPSQKTASYDPQQGLHEPSRWMNVRAGQMQQ
ncbi:hypothetical protein JOB18_021168 [Solea senegalensis]|uniref:Uncharacterized protein n=1 Tax=Solea senegalensis TaxID=28829 RepID=A0AAV6R7E4_SOLSE|nr:uncharacterized protein LOC122786749 [Solea senegalensis]KAG7500514.1 hypothetical protein JOB18_021168 [Solea senegalensis]